MRHRQTPRSGKGIDQSMWMERSASQSLVPKLSRVVFPIAFFAIVFSGDSANVQVLAHGTSYLLSLWFGSEVVWFIQRQKLLRFENGEWVRFIHNLLAFSYLNAQLHTVNPLLVVSLAGFAVFLQVCSAKSLNDGLFLSSSFTAVFWINFYEPTSMTKVDFLPAVVTSFFLIATALATSGALGLYDKELARVSEMATKPTDSTEDESKAA